MSAWADENRWYARLMKLAHDLAMDGREQEAQDLRVAATHARNYRWLRDHSSPEKCMYYLCSNQTQARFNDPSEVDRHIAAEIDHACVCGPFQMNDEAQAALVDAGRRSREDFLQAREKGWKEDSND